MTARRRKKAQRLELAQALSIAKRLTNSTAGIKAVDFGWIYHAGVAARRQGIRFHVSQKLSPERLAPDQVLPKEIMGIPCDVVEANYGPHAQSPRSAFDPIRPGISAGNNLRHSTGTLGLFVQDRQTSLPCILSNWHVLCGSTEAQPGDPIIQPGPQHLGSNPPRTVGDLLRFMPLSSGYDAAIASVSSAVAIDRAIFGIDVTELQLAEPKIGMQLVKSGALSGVTRAQVDGVDGTYQMDYSGFGDDVRWMDGIRLVALSEQDDEISLEGDSGAIWIEPNQRLAVALHFAGEDGLGPLAEYAIAHPLPRVFNLLDISLLSQ